MDSFDISAAIDSLIIIATVISDVFPNVDDLGLAKIARRVHTLSDVSGTT
jgi:hypothetical protein